MRVIDNAFLEFRRENLKLQLEAVQKNSDEEKAVIQRLALLKIETENSVTQNAIDAARRKKVETDAIEASIAAANTQGRGEADSSGKGISPPKSDGGGIWGTIAQGLGGIAGAMPDIGGQITTQADTIKAVYADLKGVAAEAIGSMVSGLANLVQQWVLTGKFSAKAALAMAAGIAVGVAIQAGIKALFQVAEGMAAAANPFTAWMAPMHFAAAKMYGTVAAYAGVAGAGLAIAGRAAGGGNSASSAFKQQTSGDNYDFRKTDEAKDTRPRSYEEDRFRRQEVTHSVNIKLDRGMIGQHVVDDFKNAGPVRGLLINLVEG